MSELSDAINEMRNMRESYNQIGAAAEAYNTGKTELAGNITAKGVQASADETLPELAEKVAAITQETYEIDGGEMYAKQLFGSLETPNYWNLYDVLAQLLSDGRLVSYGGILLAEYYRGYDSLALAGAGAGGAYVVSDKDENGQFKMYTEDTTHTWATEFDGKGNRWVAYCFADEYHDFDITDTNTSPRSIFIGRNVGEIKLLANSRISQIVVPDGNKLKNFKSNGYTCDWNKALIIRNLTNSASNICSTTQNQIELVSISADAISSSILAGAYGTSYSLLRTVIIEANSITGSVFGDRSNINAGNFDSIIIKTQDSSYSLVGYNLKIGEPKRFYAIGIESGSIRLDQVADIRSLKYLYFEYLTNDKEKSINLTANSVALNGWAVVEDVELKNGWCKSINLQWCTSLTKENVQAHIFDRLGVNDTSTGAVIITLANAVLNLFTQEEIDAVVARTNITIVGA